MSDSSLDIISPEKTTYNVRRRITHFSTCHLIAVILGHTINGLRVEEKWLTSCTYRFVESDDDDNKTRDRNKLILWRFIHFAVCWILTSRVHGRLRRRMLCFWCQHRRKCLCDEMEMRMRNSQVENDGVRVRDVMRQSRVGTISVNRLLWCCTYIIYVFTYLFFRIYWREECEQKENRLTIVSSVIMQCDGDDDNFAVSNYDFHSKLCLYYSSGVRELRFVFSQTRALARLI